MNSIEKIISKLPSPEPGYNDVWENKYIKKYTPCNGHNKISIVTPSYNQGKYIEQTIRCILLQGYENLEYIIIDGGSTDETVNIIKKYEKWLKYWISEKDNGMYDAIMKGFDISTGDIMAWSPADDLYVPDAFRKVSQIFHTQKNVEWLTSICKVTINYKGEEIQRRVVPGFSKKKFIRGGHNVVLSNEDSYCIPQQSTFWRRRLWDRTEGIDTSLRYAGDYDLWAKFFKKSEIFNCAEPIGIFRTHSEQASNVGIERYIQEQEKIFEKTGGKRQGKITRRLISKSNGVIKRLIGSKKNICKSYSANMIIYDEISDKWRIDKKLLL